MKWVYYLHTNGDLIGKNPVVLNDPDYFDSPFVKRWWSIETDDRSTLYPFLITALKSGANKERVRELAKKWGADKEDTFEFISRVTSTPETKDGLPLFITEVLGMTEDQFWEDFQTWATEKE